MFTFGKYVFEYISKYWVLNNDMLIQNLGAEVFTGNCCTYQSCVVILSSAVDVSTVTDEEVLQDTFMSFHLDDTFVLLSSFCLFTQGVFDGH